MTLKLSESQLRAVESSANAIVVVAGAGSGKTEIVAQRIERILKSSRQEGYRVLALTYTVKAADELGRRIRDRLGDAHKRVDADTMHGFAMNLLRQYGTRVGLPAEPEILSRDEDRSELLSTWLVDAGQPGPDDPPLAIRNLDLARAKGGDALYLPEWREALASRGALDYAAMLERATELAESSWISRKLKSLYEHLVIDEAQNLTPAQYRLIKAVVGEPNERHMNVLLVGDERQSIVGFAGADSTLIARFQQEYGAERIELHTNFRSAESISELARSVAERLELPSVVDDKFEYPAAGEIKLITSSSEEAEGEKVAAWILNLIHKGLPHEALAAGESSFVRPEDIAVLARSAGALRFTRDALTKLNIESAMAASESEWVRSTAARAILALVAHFGASDHMSVRRLIAELCGAPNNWEDLEQTLHSANDRGVAATAALARCEDLGCLMACMENLTVEDADWISDVALITDAWGAFRDQFGPSSRSFGNFKQFITRRQRGDLLAPGVRLLTIHKSQGREFKVVAVVACNDGQMPDFRAQRPEEIKDELRIFYVAISRSSRMLLLSRAEKRRTNYGLRQTVPSRFLELVNLKTP